MLPVCPKLDMFIKKFIEKKSLKIIYFGHINTSQHTVTHTHDKLKLSQDPFTPLFNLMFHVYRCKTEQVWQVPNPKPWDSCWLFKDRQSSHKAMKHGCPRTTASAAQPQESLHKPTVCYHDDTGAAHRVCQSYSVEFKTHRSTRSDRSW